MTELSDFWINGGLRGLSVFSLLFANFMCTHMLEVCLIFHKPMIYETVDINLVIICFQACIIIGI